MADYIFLMPGGSAIGDGICLRKGETNTRNITSYIKGYIKVGVDSLGAAGARLPGNPVYEAVGAIEIRKPPRTDRRKEFRSRNARKNRDFRTLSSR